METQLNFQIPEQLISPVEPKESVKSQYKNSSYYGAQLRKNLDSKIFKPDPTQLVYFVAHFALIAVCFSLLTWAELHWYYKLPLSLLMGFSYGLLGFIGHEIMHGSVIRNPFFQQVLAGICLTPYMGSPTFWKYWHNKLHHGHTQSLIQDPDAFPTYRIFKHSKFMKFMFPYTPGSGTLRSYAYFFFWFCFNFLVAQTYFRFRNKTYAELNHKKVNLEFAAQIVINATLLGTAVYFAGWSSLFWVWALPFMIQNYTIMSYVSTNHNLSPLTSVNDPLANSVTVTNHPILEFLHLNFGYHVEHHLYPTVPSSRIKIIHEAIKKEWPEKFQVTTKWQAMKDLYTTPRIYKNSVTLINPYTLELQTVKDYSPAKKASAHQHSKH